MNETSSANVRSSRILFTPARIIVIFVLLKLLLSLFPYHYGYFRDELYYIALSDNLGLGFVDVPPLAPFLLAVVRALLGTSLFTLHLLPAASGALFVLVSGLIVLRLGGGRFALLLTLACVTLAPQFVSADSLYSYDTFDKLFWALILYVLILLLKSENERYWVYFGLAAGVGLLTKITIGFLGFGIILGLVLTKNRKYLVRRKFWMGAALAFLIFLPYLIWQVRNGFPTLEFYANYASGKTYPVTPLQFILDQFVSLNPLAAPVWLLGLFYVLFHEQGRRFRMVGLAYLALLAVFILLKAKYYMPAPFYPVLFGAGAVLLEEFVEKRRPRFKWLKPVSVAAIFVAGAVMVPMARPVLPVETFIDYSKGWTGVKQETHELGRLPQHFADMFGWPELAAEVAKVYRSLPEEERNRACIFADNYGEAGAIWLFGKEYGLPRPIKRS